MFKKIAIRERLKQGEVLHPSLLNVIIDDIINEIKNQSKGIQVR